MEGLVSGAAFGGLFSGRRVLVTGNTGFKGSWLTVWLRELGADVCGFALAPATEPSLYTELQLKRDIAEHLADVRDLEQLAGVFAGFRPEVVFHLAAQPLVRASYADPVLTFETNVMGTVNLLEAVRRSAAAGAGPRVVVNVTSDKCYENRESARAYREDDPLGGHDPYSSSKACSELVTAAYRLSFFGRGSGQRVASARAGNVIGGGDWAPDRIVPDCVRALTSGRRVVVRRPHAVRPWQHVLESLSGYLWLAACLWDAADGGLDGAFNFGPTPDARQTVASVVELLLKEWGEGEWCSPSADAETSPHEAGMLLLEAGKARERLGWRPVWDVGAAVEATARWYREFYSGGSERPPSGDAIGDRRTAVASRTRADIAKYSAAARAQNVPWAIGAPPATVIAAEPATGERRGAGR